MLAIIAWSVSLSKNRFNISTNNTGEMEKTCIPYCVNAAPFIDSSIALIFLTIMINLLTNGF